MTKGSVEDVSIVEFLRARLDEDEAVARAAVVPAHEGPNAYKPHPELAEWFYDGEEVEYVQTPEMLAHKYPDRLYVTCDGEGLSPAVDETVGPHIARHDPARVLREVEAKRRIVGELVEAQQNFEEGLRTSAFGEGEVCALQDAARVLASVYADHPDYDPNWAM